MAPSRSVGAVEQRASQRARSRAARRPRRRGRGEELDELRRASAGRPAQPSAIEVLRVLAIEEEVAREVGGAVLRRRGVGGGAPEEPRRERPAPEPPDPPLRVLAGEDADVPRRAG